ncbi:T9SS type A sorting domain-containing protein [Flavobacterium sp.]|uniref:T9SS type A sorting domain-containing protein n=1 Tax=Flavobacterium sp. TaxID=239 RepID=UPI002B4B6EC5|nr:T9SS type A sorting domain-containing protein [Flavobacterium sp.]HLF52239.1 T9SS type A sorting domain-containing protein [Flavobacterium sp.]
MKKITLVIIFIVMSVTSSKAQLFTIPTCNGTIGSNLYGPMNSITTANATNRTAVIYPSSQLTGIAGQILNGVYFKRIAASGTMAGTPNFKVYLKETPAIDFGASAIDWATQIATATLVYDSDPTASVGSTAGWKNFVFSSNFTYSGTSNLAVFMEYVNTTALTTSITWEYEYSSPCISTTNSNTTKYINNTTGVPGSSLTSTNYRRAYIGFDFVVSCPAPTGLTATNITTNSVDLNWTAGGSETGWEYVVQPAGTGIPTVGTTTSLSSFNVGSLNSGTGYEVYTRAVCGAGDNSVWVGPVNFSTVCATFPVPSLENFTTYVPNCWQEADNGDLAAGPLTFGTSTWIADGFGNVGTTGAARYNISTNLANDWLLTPLYTIPAIGYQLKFDAAATQTGSINALTTAWESDDIVEVLVSTGTTSWTVLYTYNDTNVPLNTGSTNFINLNSYAGQDVRFAFRVVEGTSNGSANIDFSIDNFELRLTPSCIEPTSLVVNNITDSSAGIVWGAVAGSVNYEYVLDNVMTAPAGSGTSTTATNFSATSLTPLTTYYFHVRNNCGAEFSTWSTISFTTLASPPVNDNCSGAIALTVNADLNCTTVTSGTVLAATASSVDATACSGTEDDDVWFSFVATNATHRIQLLNVVGSVTDMYHSLWTGVDCNSLSLVTGSCSDSNTSNPSGLIIGSTYYLRVNTWTATSGQNSTFDVCIGTPPPPPGNDLIANASILTESTNETCNNGLLGTTDSATHSSDYSCSATDVDVWYTFTPSITGIYNFNRTITFGTGTGYVAIYSGTPGSLTILNTCSVNNFAQLLTSGITYYLAVASSATSTVSFSLCAYLVPAAPANDLCTGAIPLTAGGVFATGAVVGSTAGATTVSGLTYACQTNRFEDVWYSVTVPASGTLTIETKQVTGSALIDTVLSVFSGTCGSLTEVGCNDDGGDGAHSIISLTGQTPGSTLYIGVWKWGTSASGQFQVSAYDASLSTSGFDNKSFSAYPNPVKEVLNLSYTQNISDVAVYNLLGQQVIAKTINANQSQIDMSHLSSGTYMVKVTADIQVKMIKVIKE